MLNFNGIPVPKYLGGAHYTWQILNSDKSGGNVLQEITENIDKGPILKSDYYELSSSAKIIPTSSEFQIC